MDNQDALVKKLNAILAKSVSENTHATFTKQDESISFLDERPPIDKLFEQRQ